MVFTLYTDAGNFRAFKILIAAEYNNVSIAIPDFKLNVDNVKPEFLAKSPAGKVPALETCCGCITESNAIARYVARIRNDTGLYGRSFFESGQVDQWIDFCSNNIELPATIWIYPLLGHLQVSAAATDKAKEDLARALKILDAHLSDKTYLVGNAITLADITVATTLLYPFKFVCCPAYRKEFGNVVRWFETCVNQPNFESVIGKVVLATSEASGSVTATVAKGKGDKSEKPKWDGVPKPKAPKEEKKKEPVPPKPPKEAPKPKPKEEEEEEDEVPQEKKTDHPFKLLDASAPSPFVMDAWKRCYSNCHGDYEGAMKTFWETVDLNGYSIFRGDYMYNDELAILFMASNLIGGFIQRTDEIRKWLFGTMTIRGVEGPGTMKVTCYYLIRGQDIQPLITCNDDAACYKWTRLNNDGVVSDADKKLLFDYWTTDEALEGEPVLDSRCYK